jgi:hypothetical protein
MENYHRRSKSATNKFENYEETGSGSAGSSRSKISTQEHNRPQQHGVMLISPNGKIRNYVTRGLEVLTEADNANDTPQQEGVDTVDKTTGHVSLDHTQQGKERGMESNGLSSPSCWFILFDRVPYPSNQSPKQPWDRPQYHPLPQLHPPNNPLLVACSLLRPKVVQSPKQ